MLITYRRTAGPFTVLALAAVALLAAVLTIAAAATLGVAIAAAALVRRAVRRRSGRNRMAASASPWAHKTIEAIVVDATSSSETRNLPRMDHNSR